MANSDKDILITANTGTVNKPAIRFNGANNNPVSLYVQDSGALTIEGSAGQLFAVSDSLAGTIFAVNDSVGMPSIDVKDTGDVRIAPFSGRVAIGKTTSAYNLDVGGTVNANAYYQNGLPVGGWNLLTSGALTVGVATVSIGAIAQTYRNLRLVIRNAYWTNNGSQMYIRVNNNAAGSTYYNWYWSYGNGNNYNYNDSQFYVSGGTWSSANYGITTIDFDDYANTTTFKKMVSSGFHTSTSGEPYGIGWNSVGWYRSQAAISAISIHTNGGNFSGGTYQLYGIR